MKDRFVLSTCIAGGVILIVTVIVVGLPAVGDGGFVAGFTALIVTPMLRVRLVVIPAVFTRRLVVVIVPPARFVPASAESET